MLLIRRIKWHLFVDPLLPFMYGSNMFCHVALAREHFLAVGARNALNTAVLSLSHMNVPEEMITEKIDRETISKSLGLNQDLLDASFALYLIWELRLAFVEKIRTHR